MNFRILKKSTNFAETEIRRNSGNEIIKVPPQYLTVSNNLGLLMRLGVTTQITSKATFVLEGQVHRMERFGEIFATVPQQGHYWYKYNLYGYAVNASVKF